MPDEGERLLVPFGTHFNPLGSGGYAASEAGLLRLRLFEMNQHDKRKNL